MRSFSVATSAQSVSTKRQTTGKSVTNFHRAECLRLTFGYVRRFPLSGFLVQHQQTKTTDFVAEGTAKMVQDWPGGNVDGDGVDAVPVAGDFGVGGHGDGESEVF